MCDKESHLRPGVLLAEQVCIEVGHLPVSFIGETPHQLPVTHVMKLFPGLLGFTALLKTLNSLTNTDTTTDFICIFSIVQIFNFLTIFYTNTYQGIIDYYFDLMWTYVADFNLITRGHVGHRVFCQYKNSYFILFYWVLSFRLPVSKELDSWSLTASRLPLISSIRPAKNKKMDPYK